MSFPTIHISSRDHRDLMLMIVRLRARVAGLLISELQRAEIRRDVAPDVVKMGSIVTYRLHDGPEETRALAYPEDASLQSVSVTSPLGAALLGLKRGDDLCFTAGGREWRVQVLRVVEEPRASRDGRTSEWPSQIRRWLENAPRMFSASATSPRQEKHAMFKALCLAAIVLAFTLLFFRYRILNWMGFE